MEKASTRRVEDSQLFSALVKNYSEDKEQWGSVPPQELGLCLSAESSHAEETQEQAVRDLIRL